MKYWVGILFLTLTLSGEVLASNSSNDQLKVSRETIYLSVAEREAVLQEMRQFLEAVHLLLDAALREDMSAVDKIARPLGMQLMRKTPASLHAKLPKGFTALGPKVHQQFQAIADDARDLGDPEYTLRQIKTLTGQCIACHQMYEIKAK